MRTVFNMEKESEKDMKTEITTRSFGCWIEVLGVAEVSNLEITEDTCKKYWNMYATYKC